MKRTYQPKKRKRARTHGFRARMCDARRPRGPQAPPRQGPQAAHRLTMAGRPSGGRAPRRRRLSRSAEFERVYRQGRSKANRFLVLYAFPREDEAGRPTPGRGSGSPSPAAWAAPSTARA